MHEDFFLNYQTRINASINHVMDVANIPSERLKDAMMYTLFPGGKRLRPMLAYLSGQMLQVSSIILDPIAISVECIHNYSLIHDDLPAMDNDDYRRGKPSCHKAFDEATAILAGDALQSFAFDALIRGLTPHVNPAIIIEILTLLINASGAEGMLSGQAFDLSELSNPNLTLDTLTRIHHLKTGKLIEASVLMPLAASSASYEQKSTLTEFARQLGVTFQIHDDYLDYYGNAETGKLRRSDNENAKHTFVHFHTKEALQNLIQKSYEQMTLSLTPFGDKASELLRLIELLAKRT